MSLAEIKDEALDLGAEERAELTALLIDSLPEPDPSAESDSLREAHHRADEVDEGLVKPLSQEEFDAAMSEHRRK